MKIVNYAIDVFFVLLLLTLPEKYCSKALEPDQRKKLASLITKSLSPNFRYHAQNFFQGYTQDFLISMGIFVGWQRVQHYL